MAEVRALLGRSKEQIALALPKHLTPDRMIRVALTSLQKSPDLQKCNPLSVVACIVEASHLGLEIGGVLGQAYLVPFKGQCQLIPGYKGYIALAHRSGVSRFAAHVVRERDMFDYEHGTRSYLRHKQCLEMAAGPPIAVYAEIVVRDGEHDFEILRWGEILEMQQKYGQRKGSPWQEHLEEMAKKTAIRRLAKRCPISVEVQRAASLDNAADYEQRQDLRMPEFSRSEALAARSGAEAEPLDDAAAECLPFAPPSTPR
jgi:recombination protein RecT